MSFTLKELGLEDKTYIVTSNELVSEVIKEAIACRQYLAFPRKLDEIFASLVDLYKRKFTKVAENYYVKAFKSPFEIISWLTENVLTIPQIRELNLSEREYAAGVGVDDESRGVTLWRFQHDESPDVDDDFVDLDAFVWNIAHNIVRNNIEVNFNEEIIKCQ